MTAHPEDFKHAARVLGPQRRLRDDPAEVQIAGFAERDRRLVANLFGGRLAHAPSFDESGELTRATGTPSASALLIMSAVPLPPGKAITRCGLPLLSIR